MRASHVGALSIDTAMGHSYDSTLMGAARFRWALSRRQHRHRGGQPRVLAIMRVTSLIPVPTSMP